MFRENPMRALVCLACFATPALASSEDAWVAFRATVGAACLALVKDQGTVSAEVNPFGTQSYGVAIVTLASEAGTDRMVCVYDKASHKAELSASFSQ
jgi:hypothetical protein